MEQKARASIKEDFEYVRNNPSEFTSFEGIMDGVEVDFVIENLSPTTVFAKNGEIGCILIFEKYATLRYRACILSTCHMDAYVAVWLKNLIRDAVKLGALRIETESVDDVVNNRYHEFIGFNLEGRKRNYYNDRDYNIWSVVQWDLKPSPSQH